MARLRVLSLVLLLSLAVAACSNPGATSPREMTANVRSIYL